MPSAASKKGKEKDSSGVRAEQFKKNAVKLRKKSGRSSTKSRRLYAEKMAQDSSPGHLQERRQIGCKQLQVNL